jgi:hypothetical protein
MQKALNRVCQLQRVHMERFLSSAPRGLDPAHADFIVRGAQVDKRSLPITTQQTVQNVQKKNSPKEIFSNKGVAAARV